MRGPWIALTDAGVCLIFFLQEKLFNVAGLPMVENCMAGYNSCMFAYGQVELCLDLNLAE